MPLEGATKVAGPELVGRGGMLRKPISSTKDVRGQEHEGAHAPLHDGCRRG